MPMASTQYCVHTLMEHGCIELSRSISLSGSFVSALSKADVREN